jgi:hypothetical protein
MKIKEISVTTYTLLWSGNYMEVLVLHQAPASLLRTGFDGRASIQGIANFPPLPRIENDHDSMQQESGFHP